MELVCRDTTLDLFIFSTQIFWKFKIAILHDKKVQKDRLNYKFYIVQISILLKKKKKEYTAIKLLL